MCLTFKNCSRRFGVELEFNAFDGESRSKAENDLPKGIYDVADCVMKSLKKSVEVTKWQYTHNNKYWHVKPDSSCGLEVCSTPNCAYNAIQEIIKVVDTLASNDYVKSDSRCSFHVHVEIADFQQQNIVNLISKWINFELFFFFLTSPHRWVNQYCIPIGFSSDFDADSIYYYNKLLFKFSESKYYAINLYHYAKNKKKTIEFRIMGNEACLNSEDAANWCKLLVCFVERCKNQIGLNETFLFYENIEKILDFLNLEEFFEGDAEILQWIIFKLNDIIDKSNLSGYIAENSFWKDVLQANILSLKKCIERLEKFVV